MIPRQIRRQLIERLKAYPAVAMVGPRQCGKTTLARSIRGVYYDLEHEEDRLRLDLEWDALVAGKNLAILDEAQSWPEVFTRLRGAIDRDRRRMGRFLILGSVSPSLMIRVSESLAGRLSIVELTPFLWTELRGKPSRERRWLCGGYPDGGVLDRKQYPRWQLDYLTLLAQRDLPTWGLPAKPQTTDRLLRMLAAVHGQTWNASQVGQSLGLSYQTVNSYLDYLAGAFLIRRLRPYQTNIRKRLIKNPKVYWRDSGLLHALLMVSDERTLLMQPWVGASWEGFVIEQAIGELSSRGCAFEAYYFRTSDQYELDLVLDLGRDRWAVEIKLTASPGPADMARLDQAADLIGASRRFLVSQVGRSFGDEKRASCNLPSFIERLRRWPG
jgi:predicted AAA+ superfamily ATPase